VNFLVFFVRHFNLIFTVFIEATEGDVRVALLEKEAQLAKDGVPHFMP
jgi:hypothetical protein